ncbi:MAG: MerR family transcriptional regulator [Planctomycetes bacterium]|nr:MerR family transcriptional regulator [Planctomycetota bacterium]
MLHRNNTLSINGVAKKLGIHPTTIKRWELTGKVKKAKRDKNGWRIYGNSEVEALMAYYLVKLHL